VVLLVAWVSLSLTQTVSDCHNSFGSSTYDLSHLVKATNGTEQRVEDPFQGENTYYFRPCNVVAEPSCKSTSPPSDKPAVCQKDIRNQFHDCGSQSHVTWKQRPNATAESGFVLLFTGGEEDRQADIEFICDPRAGIGRLLVKIPAEQPAHHYHLKWETQYACPIKGDGGDRGGGDGGGRPAISGGWIFSIILLSLFVLYIIGGVAYNKFRKNAHGWELIPNHELWFALPGLVRDGTIYCCMKLRGLCGQRYEECPGETRLQEA